MDHQAPCSHVLFLRDQDHSEMFSQQLFYPRYRLVDALGALPDNHDVEVYIFDDYAEDAIDVPDMNVDAEEVALTDRVQISDADCDEDRELDRKSSN